MIWFTYTIDIFSYIKKIMRKKQKEMENKQYLLVFNLEQDLAFGVPFPTSK